MSFLTQHLAAARNAIRRLAASPLNTLLSLLVIGTALALPAGGWIVLDNVQRFGGDLSGVQQISVFMTSEAGKKTVKHTYSHRTTCSRIMIDKQGLQAEILMIWIKYLMSNI